MRVRNYVNVFIDLDIPPVVNQLWNPCYHYLRQRLVSKIRTYKKAASYLGRGKEKHGHRITFERNEVLDKLPYMARIYGTK